MQRKLTALCALALAAGAFAFAASVQEPVMPVPTDVHNHITSRAGEWEGTLTMSMPGMPTDPIPATESAVAIGGFWIQTRFECDFMGMPYVGTGITGYDPESGKYIGTWADGMSPFLAIMEGEADDRGRITMRWEAPDMTGAMAPHSYVSMEKENSYKSTFSTNGEQTMVIEMKRKSARAKGTR